MSYSAQHIKETDGYAVCSIDRVVVLIWKEAPALPGIDETRQLFSVLAARSPREKVAFLTVIEPQATALNIPTAVRDALTAMLKQYQAHIVAAVVVVDAEGFRASLVRTFVATMNLANRLDFPSNTERHLDVAARWLATRDPQLPLAADELTDAVNGVRARWSYDGKARDLRAR